MSVITLTSDYGIKDHYTGSIKGALFSELINPNIVDISHQISPFNIVEAAYIIENSYKNFPENSSLGKPGSNNYPKSIVQFKHI